MTQTNKTNYFSRVGLSKNLSERFCKMSLTYVAWSTYYESAVLKFQIGEVGKLTDLLKGDGTTEQTMGQ